MSTERVGPFTLGAVIGSGGFGTVYRGSGPNGETVAVKVLAPQADSQETIRRFEREGNIRIDHPNVVSVVDAGVDKGLSYIAFELLEGVPLTTTLEDAPLAPAVAVDLALQICAGLSAAHARDIVHRDLKPGNVFCCNDGTVKILDFGIARPMSEVGAQQLTMAGSVVGTPGYLSPEQAKGDPEILPAADLWALGVILYQALSGKNPFIRTTAVATILAVVLEEAPTLGEHGEKLPRGFAELVHRCLKKEPRERWASAEELAVALRGLDLSGSMVSGVPEGLVAPIPEDERRVVALLLASEVRDLPALDHAVREWGGVLTPLLGGAIGVFGARTYEGDEASRAVAAALRARDSAAFIAVGAGRVTGKGGTVSGEAVDAVERAVAAHVAGVAVELAAARSLGQQFELRSVADGVFEVPRASIRETGTFPTVKEDLPLLGREVELGQIELGLSSALDDQRATVLWVTGPPGIGKSRLRAELERRLRQAGVVTLAGRAESHRREVAFHLMSTVLRSAGDLEPFFMNPEVSAEERRTELHRFLTDVLGEPSWARQCADPLATLLGLPEPGGLAEPRRSDPQLMADRVRVSLADVLSSLGRKAPLALVLDDLQWADDASLSLVDELLARLADRPFLVFIAARPQLLEERTELFSMREVIRVAPRGLRNRDVAVLARTIAGRDLKPAILEEVTERTGGNPFFVEQIVRELAEKKLLDQDLAQLPIPLDVEGAVQSRLDHLPLGEKQLCKRASVFASGFTAPGLSALDQPEPDRYLGSLARRGLVSARSTTGDGREREYRFRNALVADVAYRMNSDDARKELHLQAARHLATVGGIDPEELAQHWERGGDAAKAAASYAEAARGAASRGDSSSVLRCSERALGLGIKGPEAFNLQLARAVAFSFLGRREEHGRACEEAISLANSPVMLARALTEQVAHRIASGQHDEGLDVAKEAVRVARTTRDTDALAAALARMGWLLLYAGKIQEASEAIGEAASLPGLAPDTAAHVASWKGQLYTAMGDLGNRKLAYEEAIVRHRELGDLRRLAASECNLADTLNRVGAYEEAEISLREALRFCQRVGNRVVEGYALANLGYSLAGQGRLEEAQETFEAALVIADELGRGRLAVAIRLYAARAQHTAGHDVTGFLIGVAEEAETHGLPALRASALALSARSAVAQGKLEDALRDAERAMALRDEMGTMEEDEAEIFLALAEALYATGESARAREVVSRGASRLEFLAGRIEDATWRARFLVEVPENRRLIEMDGAE